MAISPSRESSSTELISRRYNAGTGSSVRDILAKLSEMGVNVVETEEAEPEDEGAGEEAESERGELGEIQQPTAPAKVSTKEPTGRTDDPVPRELSAEVTGVFGINRLRPFVAPRTRRNSKFNPPIFHGAAVYIKKSQRVDRSASFIEYQFSRSD